MSAEPKDGGSAFPRTLSPHEVCKAPIDGMTLRDWYKGKILAGFCANPAIFAPRADCGWSLLNCTDADLIGYASRLADEAIAESQGATT